MTGAVADTLSNTNVYLYRFDENGDSLWFVQIDLNSTDVSYQCIQDDSCFVIVGQQISNNSNMFVLKTDLSGNYIWHSSFGGGLNEYGFSVDKCFDKGYILGGRSNGFFTDQNTDTYVVKVDSLGNFEWEETYGDSLFDCQAYIKQTSDSNYVMATCTGIVKLGGYEQRKARVIKIDPIGGIIWDKLIGGIRRGNELYNIHELEDGNFITVGTITDTLGSPASYNGWPNGLVIKLDSEGNEIWTREHEYFTSSNSHNYLRDISPTSDGGYIACGFIFLGTGDTGTQDFWVVKMDAEGYATGVDPIVSENGLISIYPNPATGYFAIKLSNTEPNRLVTLYNQLGVKVRELVVEEEITTVETSKLPTGVYFVQVVNQNGVVAIQKLIVH